MAQFRTVLAGINVPRTHPSGGRDRRARGADECVHPYVGWRSL